MPIILQLERCRAGNDVKYWIIAYFIFQLLLIKVEIYFLTKIIFTTKGAQLDLSVNVVKEKTYPPLIAMYIKKVIISSIDEEIPWDTSEEEKNQNSLRQLQAIRIVAF